MLKITDGGGTRRPFDSPIRTAISQNEREPDRQQEAERRPRKARELRFAARAVPPGPVRQSLSWRQET